MDRGAVLGVLALAAVGAGCDPLVDVAGAFFPGWIVCILAGVTATVIVQRLLARLGIESSMGPLLLIYPSLAAAISLALWLGLFRRTP